VKRTQHPPQGRQLETRQAETRQAETRQARIRQVETRRARIRQVEIRQACGQDREALTKFLLGLSLRTRYLRFFAGIRPTSGAMLRILAGELDDVAAVVATEHEAIIGHAMAACVPGPDGTRMAHIGLVVTDAWQGQGVGSALMRVLTATTQARGASTMVMDVLPENRQALTMIADHWPAAQYDHCADYVTIRAELPRSAVESSPWSCLQAGAQ
jgi:ribosomal protein S18 acetylase RimI-like enzyme